QVTINVDRSAVSPNRLTFYYEFIDVTGGALRPSNAPSELGGDVVTVELPFAGRFSGGRWYQTVVAVPCRSCSSVEGIAAAITLTVFSPRGEYWESAQCSIPSEREKLRRARAIRRTTPLVESSADAARGDSPVSGASALLSKIRSALIG
ncbi:MAG: hypothetical protein RL417_825, partial [Pseudomonadota bacterium]